MAGVNKETKLCRTTAPQQEEKLEADPIPIRPVYCRLKPFLDKNNILNTINV